MKGGREGRMEGERDKTHQKKTGRRKRGEETRERQRDSETVRQ